MLPGLNLLGAFIQAHIAGVAGGLDKPVLQRLPHRTARFMDMSTGTVAAPALIRGKIREGILQILLNQEHHLLRIEGGKARRVDDAGAIGQAV